MRSSILSNINVFALSISLNLLCLALSCIFPPERLLIAKYPLLLKPAIIPTIPSYSTLSYRLKPYASLIVLTGLTPPLMGFDLCNDLFCLLNNFPKYHSLNLSCKSPPAIINASTLCDFSIPQLNRFAFVVLPYVTSTE